MRAVTGRSANHLDRSRLPLTPRDYLENPYAFGHAGPARWVIPAGGNAIGLRVAHRQHVLACRWIEIGAPKSGEIRRVYGISKQTWSRVIRGQRWAGQLGLEVLLAAWDGRSP